MGQLMQVCGESVEEGDASDPPDLWEVRNAAVAEGGEAVEVQLPRLALVQHMVELLWRQCQPRGARAQLHFHRLALFRHRRVAYLPQARRVRRAPLLDRLSANLHQLSHSSHFAGPATCRHGDLVWVVPRYAVYVDDSKGRMSWEVSKIITEAESLKPGMRVSDMEDGRVKRDNILL